MALDLQEREDESAPPVAEPAPYFEDDAPHIATSRLLIACGLAAASVAWMLGGIFEGSLARVLGPVAVVLGAGTIGLASRISKRAGAEYLLLPVAFLAASLSSVALPNTTRSSGTVPDLVARAIRNGGLLQPPVPFDPGWRFLVVFLLVVLAGALTSFCLSSHRIMLVPALPLPLVLGAALLQSEGSELLSGAGSLALIVASLMVLYTAEVASEAKGGARFELKQMARGAGALLLVSAVVVGMSRVDALFPASHRVVDPRPQKPQIVPLSAVKDRVLFTVRAPHPGPWRLGVLDEYDERDGWLLPAVDPDRLLPVGTPEAIAGAVPGDDRIEAEFTIRGLEGLSLPALSNPVQVNGAGVRIDGRTQVLRVVSSSPGIGYSYTVTAPEPPSGPDLAASQGVVPLQLERFTRIPLPPTQIVDLLRGAPRNPWERLQFVRARLYAKVVAAGSGVPTAVPPSRVVAMLEGADATPFEITAAEAMLARWAGIPARIGYGFYRGEKSADVWEVRPRHGANWLEAWFPKHGWVAVVGTPPRARASLSSETKNRDVITQPSDDLTLQVYIPLKQQNPLLLYIVVRYWLMVAAPFVLAIFLLWFFLPAVVKPLRSRRRRHWASARGLQDQIAVAYAEFRDAANDLNVGDPYRTPLEYIEHIDDDDEHLEFAWLVTRALWGDLQRGLTEQDVEEAWRMSRSLKRRLTRAQTPLTRLLAQSSRASLREPFDPSLPNPWREIRVRAGLGRAVRAPMRGARALLSGARARLPKRPRAGEARP